RAHARRPRGRRGGAGGPHATATVAQGGDRGRTGGSVGGGRAGALITPQGAVGGAVEEAVDRDELAPAREHVLQHRDVPADVPAAHGAARQERRRATTP